MDNTRGSLAREIGPLALRRHAAPSGAGNADELVVRVASEARLVAESVTAALVDAGLDASTVSWRDTNAFGAVAEPSGDELAVLISDLTLSRIDDVCAHGRAAGGRWLVITDAPRGPVWGAALDGGARAVLEATISIDGLIRVLGRRPGGPVADRRGRTALAPEAVVGSAAGEQEHREPDAHPDSA